MVSETTFEQISISSTFLSSMASLLLLLFISALLFTVSIPLGFILHKIMRQVYNKRFEQNMKKHNLIGKNTSVLENTKKYNLLGRNTNVLENTKKYNLFGKNTNVLEKEKQHQLRTKNQEQQQCSTKYKKSIGSLEEWI
uniref:Uncharacterized protein n=1 Tax=Meloidogyne incognita TaxID=6306 RepID=A0A914L7G5_MELIC